LRKSAKVEEDIAKPHALVTVGDSEMFYTMVENAPEPIFLWDAKGNVLEVNKKAEELLGYTRKELTRMHLAQIHSKEELEKIEAAFDEIIKKGTIRLIDGLVLRKDGKTIPVDIAANRVECSGKKLIQGIFRDVTDRKKLEGEFQKNLQDLKERDEAIRKMSTPLVDTWENIVLIPLVGILDTARARQITESILERIAEEKSQIIVILSIGGIAAIDTKAANHILKTVHTVKLMGSEMIITGVRPDVATTLVALGIDLTGIVTRSHLREGLEYAFDKLGWKVIKSS
jgi:rsbT co-antagonist protein RsbR